jgi:hypothetical protein
MSEKKRKRTHEQNLRRAELEDVRRDTLGDGMRPKRFWSFGQAMVGEAYRSRSAYLDQKTAKILYAE